MGWRYAVASVAGTSHLVRNLPCQDSSRCAILRGAAGEEWLVAVVSDGAGSAPRSGDGSRVACETVLAQANSFVREVRPHSAITEEVVRDWVAAAKVAIEDERSEERR